MPMPMIMMIMLMLRYRLNKVIGVGAGVVTIYSVMLLIDIECSLNELFDVCWSCFQGSHPQYLFIESGGIFDTLNQMFDVCSIHIQSTD